jgi:hypothetical protein
MEIINESDQAVTWWCYNSDDTVQWVAMKEGDLRANGGRTSYDPPGNATGAYYVKITVKGGGGTYVPGPSNSGTLGGAYARRDGTIRVQGSCGYQVVRGPQRGGGAIEIVNESDMDVTWWCFNSDDFMQEIPHKQEDLKKGGRASYSPPGNATGAYKVLITSRGGHATYRWWAPDQSAVEGRAGDVPPGATIVFRGSCEYDVTGTGTAAGVGYPIG